MEFTFDVPLIEELHYEYPIEDDLMLSGGACSSEGKLEYIDFQSTSFLASCKHESTEEEKSQNQCNHHQEPSPRRKAKKTGITKRKMTPSKEIAPRFNWTLEMHSKFLEAYHSLTKLNIKRNRTYFCVYGIATAKLLKIKLIEFDPQFWTLELGHLSTHLQVHIRLKLTERNIKRDK